MATHSSVLAWRIPGMGEPGGLTSLGSHRVGHNWNDLAAYCFCPLLSPSLHDMFPSISNFLEEIFNLSHSIVFLYFLALITEEGFLISPCYSLELCIQMGISFLFSFSFHFFLFSAICKASSDNHFTFLHFFFLGMVLISASCTVLQWSCTMAWGKASEFAFLTIS